MATKWFGINSLKRLLQKIDDRYITKTDAQTKLNTKVDKVSGKALSDQNYTKFEKDKLDTIESHAQVNVLEQVKVNGKEQTITDKAVDLFVPTDDSQIANSADYQNGKQVAASIKIETDARTSADNILQSNIDSETASRLNADENLQSNIEAETSNRIAGDDALTKNLSDEVTRAKDAESTLTTNLNSEVSRAKDAESTLTTNLNSEVSRAKGAESTLTTNLNSEVSRAKGAESTLTTGQNTLTKSLNSEVARAKDAESTLTTGQNTLTKSLNSEVARAKDAESTLTTGQNTLTKNLDDHVSSKSNPHGVTKSQVGLGSVANIDQSKAIKSITRNGTTFTATALDGTTTTFTQQDNDTTYPAATSSSTGLMSASDKAKLDGIAAGANKYTHPGYTAHSSGLYKVTVDSTGHVSSVASVAKSDITALGIPGQDTNTTYSDMQGATTSADGTHGLVPTPAKGSANRYLRSDGAWAVPPNTDTKYTNMTGASTSAAGSSGLVPAPSAGTANRYLRSDGTWSVPPDTNTTYPAATSSSTGLMSASDKAKLDGIAAGANKYTHPGYTAHSSGLYKVTVDSTGHVSSVASVAKSDITALGIPGEAASKSHTHTSIESVELTGQDLNNYKSNSVQFLYAAGGNTVKNVPSGVTAFGVYCYRSAAGWFTQELISTGGKKYFRLYNDSSWTSWNIIIDSSNVASYKVNNAGYADSSGKVNGHTVNADVPSNAKFTDTTYSDATTSAHGLMTAADKAKLNGIASGATKNASTVKSFTLSASSWRNGSYTISDSLITASSNQEVLPAVGITAAQYNALSKAQIVDGGQSSGSLTIKALGTVPTIDIPIRVIFRGTI